MATTRRFNHHNSQTRSGTHTRAPRKPFVEDPDKAVFLSGFLDETPTYQWKEYREELYQAINKKYGVYIVKFDLPSNSKFGYLHVKTVKEANVLLNLPSRSQSHDSEDERDVDLENVDTPCMILAGHPVYVYEYKKTQKRKNEEKIRNEGRMQPWNSVLSNRDRECNRDREVRDNSRRFFRDSSSNNLSANSEFSTRDPSPCNRANLTVIKPMSGRDSALETQQASDEEPEKDCGHWNNKPMNNIEETEQEESKETIQEKVDILTINPLSDSGNSTEQHKSQEDAPTELTQTDSIASTTNSFDEFTTAFSQQDKFARVLLEENWDASFSEKMSDFEQIQLMILFMIEFKNKGAEAAVQVFTNVKKMAQMVELMQQIQC